MLIDTGGGRLSSAGVDDVSRAVAHELRKRGINEHSRVLLTGENTQELILTLFALMECGVSVALVDRNTPAAQQAALAAGAGVDRVLTDNALPAAVLPAGTRQEILAELVAAARSGSHAAAEARTANGAEACEDAGSGAVGDAGYGARAGTAPLDFGRWFARDDALIVWSSGSTGTPKGIVRSGASVRANIARSADRMAYSAHDVLLPLLPFTHQYGLSMLLLWRRTGSTLVLQTSSRRVDRAVEAIAAHGVTVVDAVPATYLTLLNLVDGARTRVDALGSVRMWCVGGEPLGRELGERFARTVGSPLLDGYGSSEAGNIALAVHPDPRGCGRPLDGIEVVVLDEAGRPLPAGGTGEVVVRTPDFMTGLLGPGGSVLPVGREAYHTDDIGRLDAEGNLTVLGRKNAVHRNGHTLYPDSIADRAAACGAPVQVVPVQGDRDSRVHLVFFVADPSDRPAPEWRRSLAGCVAEHELPNRVVVLPEFPLNSTGKVDRQALLKCARSEIAQRERKGPHDPGEQRGVREYRKAQEERESVQPKIPQQPTRSPDETMRESVPDEVPLRETTPREKTVPGETMPRESMRGVLQ
ncbi:class I adenylate-forming enzyme family protein [Streptomyces sp. NPDC059166]|uniref:class I adenylate-forming enzyme family protein n=1 Tax=Streptomyces sp. NPDC059166 TaxID=3346752 RepID=UPI00367AF357